ncbi:MAG: SGNH/GDSL hydrolase family protein [Oscillospiraceae bacterium]|nr:SGNH/GDSL hydrolase family protein [Oscillospiraceae bacterium]MBQ7054499.1 SGNH/GDSL hydrolase family protein [Oscillospiraceae bacterium]
MPITILFQGDSITDAERLRSDDLFRGHGYATLISAKLGFDYPNKYAFINRGIKNNTVVDLYNRRKEDIFNLKPDIMSILIGVNDAAVHNSTPENPDGVCEKIYKKTYTELINETLTNFPYMKIMILEPFLLPGSLSSRGEPDVYPAFRHEVELRAYVARKVAESFNLPLIELQSLFDDACKLAPAEYWLFDGVHPTAAGHMLIAKEWLAAFSKISKSLYPDYRTIGR